MTRQAVNTNRGLPANASEPSRVRYRLAAQIADKCPPNLGQEIALTGSAARGIARTTSDIEMNLWTDRLPPPKERRAWLQIIGAEDIILDADPIETGSIWATFSYEGVWVEAGWQTLESQERLLRAILAAKVTDHYRLLIAWVLQHAIPLRSSGVLPRWHRRLSRYPDALAGKLVARATADWALPHFMTARRGYLREGDFLRLANRLVWDVHDVLRVVFAINRQWEPDWKRIEHTTANLAIKPDRFVERINRIFSTIAAEESVTGCLELMLDTLRLVPSTYAVSTATRTVQEALEQGNRRL